MTRRNLQNDVERAAKLYTDFHAYDPRDVRELKVNAPSSARAGGPCVWVTYRSDKWNDGTHDYIHEIESRVKAADLASSDGKTIAIPQRIFQKQVYTQLGNAALGMAYRKDGAVAEVKFPRGTIWLWSAKGKALIAVHRPKGKVLGVVWGGRLGVEPRGIVG